MSFILRVQPQRLLRRGHEAVACVEADGALVHCVDNDEARRGRFAGDDGLAQRVGEDECPKAFALLSFVDRQPRQQDHSDRIRGQTKHQLRRPVGS